jgi:hypothetical protein
MDISTTAPESRGLLPRDALLRIRVGISVSESADLARLGLQEAHFRLALGEIARTVLVSGGHLAYGGHLDPTGYTPFLVQEVQRFSRRDRPLLVCLPWSEHRRLSLSELRQRSDLGLFGRLVCLDPQGREIALDSDRGEAPVPVADVIKRDGLTAMRRYMRDHINGRVLLGGKRHGFSGAIPGLMQEALLSLEAKQPIYLAGGYGGVTADIARVLGIDDGSWLPPDADAPPEDPRLSDGYAQLRALTATPDWSWPDNGLSPAENRRLAATHRPSEIATLVSLGLGRRMSTAG